MKKLHYISYLLLFIIVIGLVDTKLFCKNLLELYSDPSYSEEGLLNAINYNPDNDSIFLPKLEGKDLFAAISDLSICRIPDVRKFLYIYLTKGREYTINAIKRSHLYMPLIKEQMQQYDGIPEDIALLPLLESAFNPYAVSKSNAVGIWQFVPSTAKVLGLQINEFVDERRDIVKSTNAALRHLNHLYNTFNSWELALLAYNGGCGYLSRTMRANGYHHFYDLIEAGVLRKETAEYVYRYAALVLIYKYPELFSIEQDLLKPDIEYEIEMVQLRYPVRINLLTEKCNIPSEVIKLYNPQLKREITPPKERNYILLLPKGSKEKIEEYKDQIYTLKFTSIKTHKVKSGETLSKIAKRYRASPTTIITINNITQPDFIHPGEILYIPIN
ncbi:MAG: transglycosylase SLT domain-containing protein [Spirochaetes bacterium]|nr:transglycosylase SLT domain-containing protein [Spirochaetota bacterium]